MRCFLYALIAFWLAALPVAAMSPSQVATVTPAYQAPGWTSFTPSSLSPLAWWKASDLANGAVASWTDSTVNAYALAQATGGNQPVKAATSFVPPNGPASACVTFDGVDDYLTLASVPFPVTSVGSEIWVVIDQQTSSGTSGTKPLFGYGSAAVRQVNRTVPSGNRVSISDGSLPSTDNIVDFTGPHIIGGWWTATSENGRIDGGVAVIGRSDITLNTGTTRTRMGGNVSTVTPTIFTAMCASDVALFNPLTDAQHKQIEAWFAWNRGRYPSLPWNHPYRWRKP